jgi:site-specific recombinase XerD
MNEPQRVRKSVVIDSADESRILQALERLGSSGDFAGLRTRAFVYLLWDGALRTKAAVWLNAEELVKDPSASRVHVVQQAVQRPCEGNNYRERTFLLSQRARDVLADYLKVARSEGWLANSDRLEGPLWISTHHRGTQPRMSQRMAMQAWRSFLDDVKVSREYQLDDVVLTGRVALLQAAKGSTDAIAEHAGILPKSAGHYREHLLSSPSSTARDALARLDKQRKQS